MQRMTGQATFLCSLTKAKSPTELLNLVITPTCRAIGGNRHHSICFLLESKVSETEMTNTTKTTLLATYIKNDIIAAAAELSKQDDMANATLVKATAAINRRITRSPNPPYPRPCLPCPMSQKSPMMALKTLSISASINP